jgi:uncharacterized protein
VASSIVTKTARNRRDTRHRAANALGGAHETPHHRIKPNPDAAMPIAFERLLPILLLIGSNIFMTFAWYGHLKYKESPLTLAIFLSWGIALFEYSLMVPANRWGSAFYSAPQLKGMQEVITLVVFAGFSTWYLGQPLKWNHWAGFALIAVAAWLIFLE